jgi:CheY-like chemotaxis protein
VQAQRSFPATISAVVLLIDDVDATRQALADLLQRRGYRTLQAGTAEDGLRQLRASARDIAVIVLDLVMPKSNGWWFREQQLADPGIADVPVIVFTSAGKSEMLKYTLKVDEVLLKPASVDELLAAVERHANPRRPG